MSLPDKSEVEMTSTILSAEAANVSPPGGAPVRAPATAGSATPSLMAVAREDYRALFERLYGVAEPIVSLADVQHWAVVVKQLGGPTPLDSARTLVAAGYFYNSFTPAPDAELVESILERAEARQVEQVLVPIVRNCEDAGALAARGFESLPWFVEAVYERKRGLDADLREQKSRKHVNALFKVVRFAEQEYDFEIHRHADLVARPALVAEAAVLHQRNIEKYRHAQNNYDVSILQQILGCALGRHLLIAIRRDRETGDAVQAFINFVDEGRGEFFLCVQGIDAAAVRPGHNLYAAGFYQLMRWAEERGIGVFSLGRGNVEQKRLLGANRFHLQRNWIWSRSAVSSEAVAALRVQTSRMLGMDERDGLRVGAFAVD